MKIRFLTLAAFVGSCLMAAPAFATRTCTVEAPCVLRVATVAPPNTPWAQQLEDLEDRVESASGGRINVRPFVGSSDGELSLARQCKDGSLEAVGVSTGAIGSLVPAMSVFELPYLFESVEQADRIIDNHLFAPVERILGENGFQLYIFSENGFRNFATSNGTIVHAPGDLAGIQMRSQENWMHEAMYRALGGNPVAIPITETSTALSTGNVQGFDNTPLFAQAAGLHNFVNAWTVSNHIYQPAVVVYNKDWFDSMPADLQAILLAERESETRSGRRLIRRMTPALVANLANSGIEVYEMTDAERATFAAATRGVHAEFRSRVSAGADLLDIITSHQ